MNWPSWVRRPSEAICVAGVVTLARTAFVGMRAGGTSSPYCGTLRSPRERAGPSSGELPLPPADEAEETTLDERSRAYGDDARR